MKPSDKKLADTMEYFLVHKMYEVYFPRVIDTVYGGYITNFAANWQELAVQTKDITRQARDLWSASQAAIHYPENDTFRLAADHGFHFIKNHLWDSVNGGFINQLLIQGGQLKNPKSYKTAYGNAFAVYGLSAYYQLTNSSEALDLARKTYHWLENYSRDQVHDGYFNLMDYQGNTDLSPREMKKNETGFPAFDENYKDYNSTIHLLEAYTSLYEVWPDDDLRQRLEYLFFLVRDTFLVDKKYLHLIFMGNWEPYRMAPEKTEAGYAHHHLDHISYGHDIETAFLLMEAAHALNMEVEQTAEIATSITDHVFSYGFDKEKGGIYDAAYYFDTDDIPTLIQENKTWWSQAEALNGFLYMHSIFPEKTEWKNAFYQQWDYIDHYLLDHYYGGWYSSGTDTAPHSTRRNKAHEWKTCYHTSRAMLNGIRLLRDESLRESH